MKKVVIFGGGSGISCILSGLKLFPMDVTAVIAVSDNGRSSGQLKEELDKQKENKDQNQDNNDQKQPPLSDKAKEVLARALQLCKDGKYAEAKEMLENLIAEDETAGQLSGHVQRIDDVIEIKAGRKPKAKIDASNTDNDLEVI